METARQRAFYLCGASLQVPIAAFCLPAFPAERHRGKEWTQIGYRLSDMFVKGPFLNTVPIVKAGQWSLLGNELWHHFVLVHTVKWLGEGFSRKPGMQRGCFKWQVVLQTGIFL